MIAFFYRHCFIAFRITDRERKERNNSKILGNLVERERSKVLILLEVLILKIRVSGFADKRDPARKIEKYA